MYESHMSNTITVCDKGFLMSTYVTGLSTFQNLDYRTILNFPKKFS